MAEDKKGFILYADLITVIEKLILKDRENKTNYCGELFYHILLYVNDKDPIPIDFIVDMAFEPIKLQLKRDLDKWVGIKDDRSLNGREGNLKRWNKDLYELYKKGEYTLLGAESIAKGRKASPPDEIVSPPIAKIAVNDTVTVTVNDINNKENINFSDLLIFINSTLGKKYKVVNKAVQQKYNARLKDGYTKEDFKSAIINASKDPYHKENNFKYLTVEYFSRSRTLDLHCGPSEISKEKKIDLTQRYV